MTEEEKNEGCQIEEDEKNTLPKITVAEPEGRRDPRVDELINYARQFEISVITCGDPYGNYSMKLIHADLLDDIFTIVAEIKDNKLADDLLKLSTLVEYGRIYIMSEDVYDQIDDGLTMLIEDLGGDIS